MIPNDIPWIRQIAAYKVGTGSVLVLTERCPSGKVLVVDYLAWSLYPGGGGNGFKVEGYADTDANNLVIYHIPNNVTTQTSSGAVKLGIPLRGINYVAVYVSNLDATGIAAAYLWYHFEDIQPNEQPWIGQPAASCSPFVPGVCI